MLALLLATLTLFELSTLDLALQDHLYDFDSERWLVDRSWPVWKLLFYTAPKQIIILVALALIVALAGPRDWRRRFGLGRRATVVALLTLVSVPALVGLGKDLTNVFCPSDIERYGGDVPYFKPLGRRPDPMPSRRGRCFPAGHASGGFALVGLAWLRRSRAWRTGWFSVSLLAGWSMGLYQMLKGSHYLSHTVVTMLLSWLLALVWESWLGQPAGEPA